MDESETVMQFCADYECRYYLTDTGRLWQIRTGEEIPRVVEEGAGTPRKKVLAVNEHGYYVLDNQTGTVIAAKHDREEREELPAMGPAIDIMAGREWLEIYGVKRDGSNCYFNGLIWVSTSDARGDG